MSNRNIYSMYLLRVISLKDFYLPTKWPIVFLAHVQFDQAFSICVLQYFPNGYPVKI